MRQLRNCFKLFIPLCLLLYLPQTVISQNKDLYSTKTLDSLMTQKAYVKADSVLAKNINDLRAHQDFLEMTRRIYYFGKIALNLNEKDAAIQKTLNFAKSITNATDSLEVSRQKHLVLARFYVFIRDYKNAANENLLALEDTKKMPDATGDLFGLIHHNLSIDYRRQGNIKDAIWHSKKSVEYYLSYPKSDKIKVLDAYNSLGARMWDAFKIDSALYYFKKGEKIIEELEPTAFNKYYHKAKTQSNISSVNKQLGNISEAMAYNEKAIKNYNAFINSDADGKDFFKEEARLFLFLTIQNYAEDFISQGNYTKARDLNKYVYDQIQIHMPDNYSELGYAVLNLGNIYLKLKNYELSEAFFDKGLEIYSNDSEGNPLGLADAYYYKGVISEFNGKNDQAKTFYELSREQYEHVFGNNYDEFYLKTILNYSNFYSKNGYSEEAIEMAQKAYDYIVQNQGKSTTAESSQLINLANIYFNSKDYDKALNYINLALDLFEEADKNYKNTFSASLKKPIALLLKSKIIIEAQGSDNLDILKSQFQNLNQAISIIEQQKTIITEEQNLSIILEDNDDVFEYSKQVALWLYQVTKDKTYLNSILSLHESKLYNRIRQQLNVKADFSVSEIPKAIIDEEKHLLKKLKDALEDNNDIEEFIEANRSWEEFLNQLKNNHPKYYDLKYASISKTFESTKHAKDAYSILRYIYIYDALLAFIIETDNIEVFELNSAQLNNALERFVNDNEFYIDNTDTYYNLYTILWQPLEQSLSNKNIIIIPDGNLFNLSFEVLTTKKSNSYKDLAKISLLHKYCISYNYSLLLLNKNQSPKLFENNFIAFSPEFTEEMKDNYKTAIKDSVFLDRSYLKLLPQPFATDLAEDYSKLFDGKSFINENASKQIFTSSAKEHKIIHIGTHAESNNVSPELSRLIFAKNVNDTIATDDNSLYTYEIYNQNLSSNLAILTACETGKPTYQAGEGMISLAHAFNYAGSESILTSLWKIDEKSSTEILDYFYENISNGMAKDLALKHAKLKYLETAEERTLAPQYWAGLVIIGDISPIDLKTSSNLIYWLIGVLILILLALLLKRKSSRN